MTFQKKSNRPGDLLKVYCLKGNKQVLKRNVLMTVCNCGAGADGGRDSDGPCFGTQGINRCPDPV